MPGEEADGKGKKKYKVEFKQIYLSKPMVTEADGMTSTLFPKEARLRNLTYSAPLYIDMAKSTITTTDEIDATTGKYIETIDTEEYPKVFFGKVPIMLRSQYCFSTTTRTRSSPSLASARTTRAATSSSTDRRRCSSRRRR